MRSLYTDPISWWPLGLVIGALIGAVLRRHDRRTARDRQPSDEVYDHSNRMNDPSSTPRSTGTTGDEKP